MTETKPNKPLPRLKRQEALDLHAEGVKAWNEWAVKPENKGRKVDFSGHTFDKDVSFRSYRFPGKTIFKDATFSNYAAFDLAKFSGGA